MISTTTVTSTSTSTYSSTESPTCENCNPDCDYWTTILRWGGTVVAAFCNYGTPASESELTCTSYEKLPEAETAEYDKYPFHPFDRETLKLWRELSGQRPQYKSKCVFKPYIKRRTLNSRSGWLARVGRKKKRGK